MTKPFRVLFSFVAVAFVTGFPSSAQLKRSITPADCVTVRELQFDEGTFRSTIQISPDRTRIAYSVRSPNLRMNFDDIELYVCHISLDSQSAPTPLMIGTFSAIRWRPDGKTLTALMKENGHRVLEEIDADSGSHRVMIRADVDIAEYSVSADGRVVVYTTIVPTSVGENSPSAEDIVAGYRIPFQTPAESVGERERLFVVRRTQDGWSQPEPITISSPLSKERLSALRPGNAPDLNPALSPDGTKLLLTYFDYSEQMPDEWVKSGAMHNRQSAGVDQAFHLVVVHDLSTGETTMPLKTPFIHYAPLWSADGKSFVAVAKPVINTNSERQAFKNKITGSAGSHLFWVELGSGKVEEVASKLAYPHEGPLVWDKNGDLLVRIGTLDTIKRYSRKDGEWRITGSWHLPFRASASRVTADETHIIGPFDNKTTPPQLFIFNLADSTAQVFAKLNPQFDHLTLAQPREIHWKTSTGFDASGVLLLPPDYVPGRRYPLLIHTKPFSGSFVCSAGNFPSFAPQPIASAGIMYFGPGVLTSHEETQREEDYFPKGYPGYQGVGGLAEAAFAMDYWDTGVKVLEEQGLIDSTRVGIIGFSRTGWYTEFILTHSQFHYRAATAADNVAYSLGEYWLLHDSSTIKSYDQTYGGPPYGPTFKNWVAHSISFNADKIHTPLLLENMGYGMLFDKPTSPPLYLMPTFELFTALNRLKKPVELYYYPEEDHAPAHPKARLATMQRNVDWYRFWLKGEERTEPIQEVGETKESLARQYERWRGLQRLQEEDDRKVAEEKVKPN